LFLLFLAFLSFQLAAQLVEARFVGLAWLVLLELAEWQNHSPVQGQAIVPLPLATRVGPSLVD
jgi:hypothetical protein